MRYKALQVLDQNGTHQIKDIASPPIQPGEVLIKIEYSSLNYKDALAVTGKGKILKKFPLVAGIDTSGTIFESLDPRFEKGEKVLITGCGIGEETNGGFAEFIQAKADSVIKIPHNLSTKEAMIYGTAGFTAALCITRLEINGQSPLKGEVLVTGASGGVGSFSVNFLHQLGYKVVAVSGKEACKDYLHQLGADTILSPQELHLGTRPLEKARWAGAIDNVGGEILSGLTRHIQLWGNIASVGLASGHELKASVMPFILRGISLLGISSNNCPRDMRDQIWQRLSTDLKPKNLDFILQDEITLDEVPQAAEDLINRKIFGRYIICL